MESTKPSYQESFELHYNAALGMLRHTITRFADESVEVAARAVALAAPLPNAINMYNVARGELGWSLAAALTFALTLEIVVFLLVEIALKMWDGYLASPARYRYPFYVSVSVVLVGVVVVMSIVYRLESFKVMAALPIISLCSFVAIGLKRWDERNVNQGIKHVKSSVKSSVKSANDIVKFTRETPSNFTVSKVDARRKNLLSMLMEIDGQNVDALNKTLLAKRLDVSRPTLLSDLSALESSGKLTLNGHVKISK